MAQTQIEGVLTEAVQAPRVGNGYETLRFLCDLARLMGLDPANIRRMTIVGDGNAGVSVTTETFLSRDPSETDAFKLVTQAYKLTVEPAAPPVFSTLEPPAPPMGSDPDTNGSPPEIVPHD